MTMCVVGVVCEREREFKIESVRDCDRVKYVFAV
jgi:hypothetical protein